MVNSVMPSNLPRSTAVRCVSTMCVRQPFDIDHYQPVLFVADSFEQVYELAGDLRDSIAV